MKFGGGGQRTAEVELSMVTSKIWPALVATYIRDGQPANLIELTASIPISSGSRLTSTIACIVLFTTPLKIYKH